MPRDLGKPKARLDPDGCRAAREVLRLHRVGRLHRRLRHVAEHSAGGRRDGRERRRRRRATRLRENLERLPRLLACERPRQGRLATVDDRLRRDRDAGHEGRPDGDRAVEALPLVRGIGEIELARAREGAARALSRLKHERKRDSAVHSRRRLEVDRVGDRVAVAESDGIADRDRDGRRLVAGVSDRHRLRRRGGGARPVGGSDCRGEEGGGEQK